MTEGNINIAVLVGSLRAASHNRALAEVTVANAPDGISLTVVDGLADLPFYNEDLDTPELTVAAVTALRDYVESVDAVLIVTPEYNGTMPAVLKNAIDWLSRPFQASALSGTPAGVIGAALGGRGGAGSRQEARRALTVAGARVVEDVEIGISTGGLDDAGMNAPAIVEQTVLAVRVLGDHVAVSV